MSHERYFDAGKCTRLMIDYTDKPKELKNAFLSKLLPAGAYVVDLNQNPPRHGYVISSTERGAIVKDIEAKKINGQIHIIPVSTPGQKNWDYWFVTDPKGLRGNMVEVLPPAASKRYREDGVTPVGIAIVCSKDSRMRELLDLNGRRGFKG